MPGGWLDTAFGVPVRPAELETATSGWVVKKKIDATSAGLADLLLAAADAVRQDATALASHDTFDLAYAALRAFGSLPPDAQRGACDLAADAVQQAARAAKRALGASAPDRELAQWRSLLKAAVYLQSWLLQEAERYSAQASEMAAATKPKGARGAKKGAKEKDKGDHSDAFSWDAHRETAVLRLLEALELNLTELWGHRPPDEAFLALFSRAAYTILEQPAALKSGAASLREALWRLIAIPAVKFEQTEATTAELVRLLLGFEHCTTHLAELMQRLLEDHEAVKLVADLLRELATLPASEMGADSNGAKNIAVFLHALAARAPLMLVANLELLQPHLSSEAYSLRCGAVSAHGQLLIQIASLRGTNPEAAAAVDNLLSVPLRRLCDNSSFVRSRALQTLALLSESRALPISKLQLAATAGLARLADKNANVRRGALQLFTALLEFNPFGPSLSRPLLEERRDVLREKLGITAEAAEAAAAEPAAASPKAAASPAAASPKAAAEEGEGAPEAAEGETAETTDAAPAETDAPAEEAPPPAEEKVEEDPATRDERMALELIEMALKFEATLRGHLPEVNLLLGSQTNSDVTEAMNALVTAHSFELEGARPAKMLTLVWSKEPAIRTAALQAAQSVWLRLTPASGRGGASLGQAIGVARGMFDLVAEANLAELTSLEEVLAEWQRGKLLPASFVTVLWDVVQGRRPELAAPSDRRGALALLNMAAIGEPSLLRCKMELLIAQLNSAKTDLALARHGCVALQRCASAGPVEPKAAKSVTKAIEKILTNAPAPSEADEWFATAEQAIGTIYVLSAAPEPLLTSVLRKMGAALSGAEGESQPAAEGTVCPAALGRLIFCVGHVAMKTLVHIESCRKQLDKRRSALADGDATADRLAQELGTSAAAAEEQLDVLDQMAQTNIVTNPNSLLGAWAPLVIAVCKNSNNAFGAELRASATLTMCKLMCVSSEFCESQLQLLFTVMKNEPEQSIRANIAIALGDLFFRHPNILTPWTAHLYAQLRDGEPRVRKNVLMVLMHLILNDMVKVQGQVSELALCLLDADERIAALAKLFFTEFAKKGTSPVYNLLPDIVSSLGTQESLSADGFREILGFLITFIQKDRQTESMVEKLCLRFDTSDAVQHHRQVAFCLGALTHTDKSVKKLIELFRTYGNKLGDDEVLASFQSLTAKARKGFGVKAETKAALDELDTMLCPSQATEGDEAAAGATAEDGASAAGAPTPKAAAPTPKAAAKKPAAKAKATRGKAKKKPWEEEDDEENDEAADEENAGSENVPAAAVEQPAAKPTRAASSRSRRAKA